MQTIGTGRTRWIPDDLAQVYSVVHRMFVYMLFQLGTGDSLRVESNLVFNCTEVGLQPNSCHDR